MFQMMLSLLERQCRYQKTHFLVEPGDFVLPVSQRSDVTQGTDGSFRPSQLDVVCIEAEVEMHLGSDYRAVAQGSLLPSLRVGGEHHLLRLGQLQSRLECG